jgi:hypothetical protein
MKFNGVDLGKCVICGGMQDITICLYTQNEYVKSSLYAYCSKRYCTEIRDHVKHTKMTVEEAKLYVIKSKL